MMNYSGVGGGQPSSRLSGSMPLNGNWLSWKDGRPHFFMCPRSHTYRAEITQMKYSHQHRFGLRPFLGCLFEKRSHIAQTGLEFPTLLPHPTQPWDCRQFSCFLFISIIFMLEVPGGMGSSHACGCALNWHGLLSPYSPCSGYT